MRTVALYRWGVSLSGVLALVVANTAAHAESRDDRCKVEPGQPQPQGCSPWSGRSALAPKRTPADASTTESQAPRAPKDVDPEQFRHNRLERRTRALLMRELAQLERLFRSTPEGSPERARIVLRLADTFAELARVSEIERLEAGDKARAAAPRSEAPRKAVATKKQEESASRKKDGD